MPIAWHAKMSKTAIITLAGMSSRFSKSVGYECHKSLYRSNPDGECLLDWQLALIAKYGFDQIVLVGGYKYDELALYVRNRYEGWPITLVRNDHYSDLGSGYSLCLGVEAVSAETSAVLFMEGDLLFDEPTFKELASKSDNAITTTKTIVDARTSVAFYVSDSGRLRYVYDTKHETLTIPEAFLCIGNSGQVWQFFDARKLKSIVNGLSAEQKSGTNLVPIVEYFKDVDAKKVRICQFDAWFNCNTIADYRNMEKFVEETRNGSN